MRPMKHFPAYCDRPSRKVSQIFHDWNEQQLLFNAAFPRPLYYCGATLSISLRRPCWRNAVSMSCSFLSHEYANGPMPAVLGSFDNVITTQCVCCLSALAFRQTETVYFQPSSVGTPYLFVKVPFCCSCCVIKIALLLTSPTQFLYMSMDSQDIRNFFARAWHTVLVNYIRPYIRPVLFLRAKIPFLSVLLEAVNRVLNTLLCGDLKRFCFIIKLIGLLNSSLVQLII